MREQVTQRLGLMQERLDRSTSEVAALRKENTELRLRLDELNVAQEEAKDFRSRSMNHVGGHSPQPQLVATSLSSIRAENRPEKPPLGLAM